MDFYTEKEGGAVTITIAGAESSYADALIWRNDRLGKANVAPLRPLLRNTLRDACEVGSAVTNGGTMWQIIGAELWADSEEALYTVLTGKGTAPKRVVSEVNKAYAHLRQELLANSATPDLKKTALVSLKSLRKDLDLVIAAAAKRPRKASDALLEFCVKSLTAADR